MDAIDALLIDAWNNVCDRLAADPDFAARRLARASRRTLYQPLRAFCVTLRSSDTRLWTAPDVEPFDAEKYKLPHELYLNGETIRFLTAPVRLPPEGLRARDAARLLGMDVGQLANWIRRGAIKTQYDSPSDYSYRGKRAPRVFSALPLDPSSRFGHPPDPLWKNLWMSLASKIPDHFAQWLTRIPRWRTWRGRDAFRGWLFQCPGRWRPLPSHKRIPPAELQRLLDRQAALDQLARDRTADPSGLTVVPHPVLDHDHTPGDSLATQYALLDGRPFIRTPCGRTATRLYGPVSLLTLGDYLGQKPPIDFPSITQQQRSFACKKCWNPVYVKHTDPADLWNLFVTHITAGVLTGRDVPRPKKATTRKRRHRPYRHKAATGGRGPTSPVAS